MAKRPLGLGKSSKQKKQKKEGEDGKKKSVEPSPEAGQNQIEITLDENENADDELVQLQGLWKTFLEDKENQLLLNGVVHECDRLLREQENDEKIELNDVFHSIYAQALAELTVFLAEEDEEEKRYKQMHEFFEAALDRQRLGAEKYPESKVLSLIKSKIILQRIPLQYISQLTVEDENEEKYRLHELLEEAKEAFVHVPGHEQLAYDVMLSFYDLLDIIETFEDKEELEEGLDSDDEEEVVEIELPKKHPLKKIKNQLGDNYKWLESRLVHLFNSLSETKPKQERKDDSEDELSKQVASTLGQLYLKLAEEPSKTFAELMYDSDDEEQTDKKSLKKAKKLQSEAIPLVQNAIKYLEEARVDDDPQTWVDVAEAIIDLGNLYDYESKEQEESYKKAEDILRKANKAAHGKYQVILDNLVENQ